MNFPEYRARRVRSKRNTRSLLRETRLTAADLICPLHVVAGRGTKQEIPSLPGIYTYTVDLLREPVQQLVKLGVGALLLYGQAERADDLGNEAVEDDALIGRALQEIKQIVPEMVLLSDVSLRAYTSRGLEGIVEHGAVDNDATLDVLAEMATLHAKAGADFVCPSGSMDGQVGWLRETLDEEHYDQVGIVPCSVRYHSVYSARGPGAGKGASGGPGDSGADCAMDPANAREAIREVSMDVEEGADMIMIEPAASHLDVVYRLSEEFDLPLVAHEGQGAYQQVIATAERGWVPRQAAMFENLIALRRSGADAVVSYHAFEVARALRG